MHDGVEVIRSPVIFYFYFTNTRVKIIVYIFRFICIWASKKNESLILVGISAEKLPDWTKPLWEGGGMTHRIV
jgi:hypothetical protein